ncbi:GNAT family N-acetyltransferase [Staphylococcus sp. ACRSN]|uniref:GNAT family N-acetyltransferase n=1 Tax=Staphylococcus sp. ACRSN TaxID=2918214 RepID=UPI001EF18593|nr:GNAT family N-acetyltransferase [Staphylococcus sp. ACRSN]MCG7338076.1 GNAT family N-acetyltransferase [Staphylococcus sp. ACRSN]
MNIVLETKRLFLIRPTEYYLEELYQLHADPKTNLYNPAGPQKEIDETKEMLNEWQTHWSQYDFGYCLMIEKESETMIGMCGLKYKTLDGNIVLNLAYRLSPKYARKGYTKEACQALIQYIKKVQRIDNRIVAHTKINNIPSIQTAKSLGFSRDEQYDNFEATGDVYLFENI